MSGMGDPTMRHQAAVPVLMLALAAPLAGAEPFDRCGTYIQGLEGCVVFETEGDAMQVQPDLTPPAVGTRARLRGELAQCTSFCFVPCITGAVSSACVPTPVCGADFDLSGTLTPGDIFAYLDAWFAGNLGADYDQSGALSVQDIFAFIAAWFTGC
jgi:hypothetical protein